VVRPEGEAIGRCLNASCPARLKESIRHFARREAMDIEGLGDALVDQLIARGMVRELAGIYDLKAGPLADLERMGEKSAENLMAQIDRSREAPLERVIYALGIRFVGERTAQLLAEAFPSMTALLAASEEDLMRVPEVGERVAASIRQFFEQPENRRLVERLKAAGVAMAAPGRRAAARRGPFTGKTCVITGTVEGYPREAIKRMLLEQGARVSEAVSKKTDLLICGADPGSKLDKAIRLGVKVMDAEQFRLLAEGRGSAA
jgi:DNA ligase (NAD+)